MEKLFKNLVQLIKSFFSPAGPVEETAAAHRPLPDIWFEEVRVVYKTPSNNLISEKQFIEVRYNGTPRWVLFRCPCRCGEVISLPIQPPHSPRWRVFTTKVGRPSLNPSIWRNKGCMSHFWIEDGRVFWCSDAGVAPWIAKPAIYRQRSNGRTDFEV